LSHPSTCFFLHLICILFDWPIPKQSPFSLLFICKTATSRPIESSPQSPHHQKRKTYRAMKPSNLVVAAALVRLKV
jgi:hypothetical protein